MGEKRIKWRNFCSKAGRLCAQEVWQLGFEDNDYNPWFPEDKIPTLQKFCADNPQFHIMSADEDTIYNYYIPGVRHYYLADGDATPDISIEINLDYTEEELLELEQSEVFTKFREMQRNRGIPTLDELFPKRKIN
jgi:hypothetical protein